MRANESSLRLGAELRRPGVETVRGAVPTAKRRDRLALIEEGDAAEPAEASERRLRLFALANRTHRGFDGLQLPVVGPSLVLWFDM